MALLHDTSTKRPAYEVFPSPSPSLAVYEERHRARPHIDRRKRFFRHLFVLCVFLGLLFLLKLNGRHHLEFGHEVGHNSHWYYPHHSESHWSDEVTWGEHNSVDLPVSLEVTDHSCAKWPEVEHLNSEGLSTVQHTFELPIDSEILFLVARGSLMDGNVNIIQSDDENESAIVSISTSYDDAELLQSIKLCKVAARKGENGVGIFSSHPHPLHHIHHIHFEITVAFPKGSGPSPLVVSDFRTEMKGVFGHQVANLSETLSFNSVSLNGAYRPVQIQSLQAKYVDIKSAHSPIEGNFTVKKSLRLSTANAHINVAVDLLNDKTDEDTTEVIMKTANSPIEASISLFSFDSGETSSSDGVYRVRAHNANGPVKITFPTAPINSTVRLDAKTARAPVNVQMHNTFEGAFTVHTTPFDKKVIVAEEGPDPEERDRKRNLIFDDLHGGISKGHVYWGTGELGKHRGLARLDTVVGEISLKF
ncbi:hypothetical protein F5890DRAFT_1471100 [Lentinula detonsa]|uniref:DUF7330 domain-containing protein n=1 Tax=Lentinula detonsa TaxID=2804962 RepID=A0AA38UXW5_9AGAR|nr:hypothetical protein F5890DRAFT_1471100 [Lentinula detonsa]